MEPDFPLAIGPAGRNRAEVIDLDLLPTRREARSAIREAMARARGPVVLTGEPGSGKTALWRTLEVERGPGMSWIAVEITPGLASRDLFRLIAHALGVKPDGFGRPELLELLAARSLDGERATLVIDEAQNLGVAVLEEVRVLSNRLGEPDGFEAILLVGQTPLARWLAGNEGRAFASRLAGRVHLKPLDVDEVEILLDAVAPGAGWSEEVVERVHLETRGRPGLVIDRATREGSARPTRALDVRPPEPEPTATPPAAPLVGPGRPPIRVEDGLIEVGWAPEPEPLPVEPASSVPVAQTMSRGEQRVDDPYAALQAWSEWATNQGRQPERVEPVSVTAPVPADQVSEPAPAPIAPGPRVWADEEHGFAPFGRLFGRLPQENETD